MQLDQMRNWLKTLVVLVALAAGFPAAAWAHAGHAHGAQPSFAQAVSPPVAVVPVKQATGSRHSLKPGQLTAEGFVVSIASPSAGQRIAHAAKSVGGSQVGHVRSQLDATPANEPVEPVDQSTCCCGGIACHAGMDAPTLTVTDPWTLTARVELPPVLALTGAVPGGIERPPRGSIPLSRDTGRTAPLCVKRVRGPVSLHRSLYGPWPVMAEDSASRCASASQAKDLTHMHASSLLLGGLLVTVLVAGAQATSPDDPRAPVKANRYSPVTSGTKSYRPVEPLPWGDVNRRVAPKQTPKDKQGAPTQPKDKQ